MCISLSLHPVGSSPPVRGALWDAQAVGFVAGLIPARAGSTRRRERPKVYGGAHPRPCGEHEKEDRIISASLGSSPPVRGARLSVTDSLDVAGLIPARAGSTQPRMGS